MLALVGVAITLGVYGVVAIVVKVDDVGLHLARAGSAPVRTVGRGLVRGMPPVMAALSAIGTAAMIWVGGGILLHGAAALGLAAPAHALEGAAEGAGAWAASVLPGAAAACLAWAVGAAGAGCVGLIVGGAIAAASAGVRALTTRLRG